MKLVITTDLIEIIKRNSVNLINVIQRLSQSISKKKNIYQIYILNIKLILLLLSLEMQLDKNI